MVDLKLDLTREGRALRRVSTLALKLANADRSAIDGMADALRSLGFGLDEACAFVAAAASPLFPLEERRVRLEALRASAREPGPAAETAMRHLESVVRFCDARAELLELQGLAVRRVGPASDTCERKDSLQGDRWGLEDFVAKRALG